MKDIRNIIADTLVGWAVSIYVDPDYKISLAKWVVDTFTEAKPNKKKGKK